MYIDIIGQGPPLVLIHGWAMHGGVFEPLLKQLCADFQCHVVDLPGYGLSAQGDALRLNATVDRLLALLPSAPWLGWSLGGLFALEAAVRAPDRVLALVAVAASPQFVRSPAWPHAVRQEVFAQFAADLAQDRAATIDRFLALAVHGNAGARQEIRWLRQRLAERPPPVPRVLVDGLGVLAQSNLRGELPTLQVPSLWIGGKCDRLVPWQALATAADLAPAGQFIAIDGAGHAPFLGQADAVADAIRTWARPIR